MKPKVIAFDGPRGCGKSTLIDTVKSTLKLKGRIPKKFKAQRSNDFEATVRASIDLWKSEPDTIWLLDRFVWSKFVMDVGTRSITPADADTLFLRTCLLFLEVASNVDLEVHFLLPSLETIDMRLQTRNDGRGWDMDRHLVHPLWNIAINASRKLYPEIVYFHHNNESSDLRKITKIVTMAYPDVFKDVSVINID